MNGLLKRECVGYVCVKLEVKHRISKQLKPRNVSFSMDVYKCLYLEWSNDLMVVLKNDHKESTSVCKEKAFDLNFKCVTWNCNIE